VSGASLIDAGRRRARMVAAVALPAVLMLAAAAGTARAAEGPASGRFLGIGTFHTEFLNRDGSLDTQAGSHPYDAKFFISFNTPEGHERGAPDPEVREVVVNLPKGLVADPTATPRCTLQELDTGGEYGHCPPDTQVGKVKIGVDIGASRPSVFTLSLFNMVPPGNEPAQLGLIYGGYRTLFNAFVRTNGDYGIGVRVPNIPQVFLVTTLVTVWGDPAEAVHDSERSTEAEGCISGCESTAPLKPFWTMPTVCGGPLSTGVTADGWGRESELAEFTELNENEGVPFGYTGCEHLRFTPTISIKPESADAETPTGLSVALKEPQEGLANPVGVAQSDIKTTTVTLPEGVTVNPGTAAGLGACQTSEDGVGTLGPPSCPEDSKLGTAVITTPLLQEALEGNVYVLQSNPPHLQLLLSGYAAGVYLKTIGEVTLNETTGQLTVTFPDTPQFPLSEVTLNFGGGPKAEIVSPTTCGIYGTASDFTPWSTPFVNDARATDEFPVTAGVNGGPCVSSPSQLPFTPTMTAGATTDQAGGYTSFSMLLQREDGQQRIGGLQFKTPEGLLGKISTVKLCEEPQASQGTCSAASQIGHTVVGAGPGPFPLFVPETGKPPAPIYLTGPYKGAPYGLSIVVPVVAGPFNLGQIVVRSGIEVDPHTSRLTITVDPKTLPTILDGVPADLRDINVVLDRPEFMFNPTSCAPMAFTGTAYSTEGASAPLYSHFQVGSCRSLKFNPDFQAFTSSKTSRLDGASLISKVIYPTGALGANQASSQSNIEKIKVELPKLLPARLTTLQKACLAATFETNPAACPPASVVGHALVQTPVLPQPLTGPAYFVSHGNEKFPSLEIDLQGDGVTIQLVGSTFINVKTGTTSSTFEEIPDVPIGLFELTLPEGPYSALAAVGDLCKSKLAIPTEFIGDNGAEIVRNTNIEVTGCPKAKHAKKKKAGRHGAKHAKGKRKRG
jgi:hypothetical protein